ncbi:hypothetical protein GOP47_0001744 [Adiantum capillus-veneris]|uniref:IRG-type G domain-containing protein n=1 Tax=Adiantum capillus-veneris TaxID=13818 RepID=A0A9D4ZQB6_ADICA|nr:hypothetical protein GOP47_0001744 [Adiantum capillus-veneris]
MAMAQLLGAIGSMVEKATRPPPPPIDRTLPQPPITRDNLDENIKTARTFYNMDRTSDFHVAVVGAKGVGKSSLINGLCNRRDDEEGAAPVGRSNNEPKAYRSAMTDALVLWEMPGAGVGHPSLTYFVDKKLYAFNLILLVSDRFHRVDFEVARYASHLGRRLIFVRTKADIAVHQILEHEESSESDGSSKHHVKEAFETLRREVEASFREGLRLCGLSDKWGSLQHFLVSARTYLDGPSVYASTTDDDYEDYEDEGQHKLDEDSLLARLNQLTRQSVTRRMRTVRQRNVTNKTS